MRARWQWSHAVPVSARTMTSPSLREVHDRLVRLGSEPVSDADAAWQDLRRKLPDRPLSWSGRLMAWLRRPAIAMMTTGLLSTGVAHAAGVQPVRSGVDWLIGGVTSIVGAKSEAVEPDARAAGQRRPSDGGAGPAEENRRRLLGGAGLDHDRGTNEAPAGRGRPVPGGAGSGGDEDRDEPRDQDRDRREREDDSDELEDRNDSDDEEVEEPDDEELQERDDEEVEEPDDDPTEADRDVDADERDHLEGDAYDELEPEEDPASP